MQVIDDLLWYQFEYSQYIPQQVNKKIILLSGVKATKYNADSQIDGSATGSDTFPLPMFFFPQMCDKIGQQHGTGWIT